MPSPRPSSHRVGRPAKGTQVDYSEVVRRLRAGEYNIDLAREYGVSPSAITQGARRHGFCVRHFKQKPRKLVPIQRVEIVKLMTQPYKPRGTRKAVAARFGVCENTIDNIVRRHEVSL